MFLSCSHFNVSSFALKVSATAPPIRTSCELRMAMFLRRRDYVFAPLQLDDPTEVEVTDPTHPLFGRRFALLSSRPQPHRVGYIFVAYRDSMVLRILQSATNLVAPPPESEPTTKLTSHAVTELISLAEQCEVLCPAIQPNSGIDSHPRCKPVSAPTSRRSSRR